MIFAGIPVLGAALLLPRAHARWGGCHHGGHIGSEEDIKETMGFFAGRVLKKVDATEEQQDAVEALVDGLAPDIMDMRAEKNELRREARAVLASEQVSREDLEALRKKGLSLAEKATARMVDVVSELSQTLTAEQRLKLVERWQRRHH